MQSWLDVDLGAVARNAGRLAERVAPARLCAVVKSNAYGHGLERVARALAQSQIPELRFGVFACAEAATLRDAGIRQPIFVMGSADQGELDDAAFLDLEFALLDEADVDAFARRRIRAHVKVETGTRRFGMIPQTAARVVKQAADSGARVVGVYSHLANAEDLDEAFTQRQLDTLLGVVRDLRSRDASTFGPVLHHIAASAAAMMWPNTRLDMVRCGIALYGAWPSSEVRERMRREAPNFTLEPALRWFAPIVQLKDVAAGEPVGYGCAYSPDRDSKIAVLPLGYADGLPRAAGNGNFAIRVRGAGGAGFRAPIVGRICMNVCMADVTEAMPQSKRGDVVELDVEELAAAAATINYEILARLSPTLQRRYLD